MGGYLKKIEYCENSYLDEGLMLQCLGDVLKACLKNAWFVNKIK